MYDTIVEVGACTLTSAGVILATVELHYYSFMDRSLVAVHVVVIMSRWLLYGNVNVWNVVT